MTFKSFIFGLLASFGLPWLAVVVLPYSKMRALEPAEYEAGHEREGKTYSPERSGRVTEGSKVYGQEGCYYCHTQIIRPTYAGQDVHRDEWAGLRLTADNPDTRRETIPVDYEGEHVAHVGFSRVGPDLSNLGRRLDHYLKKSELTPETWLYLHLYDARKNTGYVENDQEIHSHSSCPSKSGLFTEVPAVQAGDEALPLDTPEGVAVVPTDRARALVSYLASLKKDTLDNPLPKAYNLNPTAPTEK
ncbi:hypothetical protein N9230_01010 [Akkermansiaceae bacterium]|nr:hypothetical protein [Akkermansiaceae bacterium]